MCAISAISRRKFSSRFFLQGKALKIVHAILKEILGEDALSTANIKHWVA
jgi:hypothetical protein